MPAITFDEIRERVARHEATEAARNAPVAVARRCVFELRSVLSDLGETDRRAILKLLVTETSGLPPIVACQT